MFRLLVRHKSEVLVAIGIIIIAILPLLVASYWTRMLTQVLIMALFATGLNMEMGYAGLMPLGQSMFLGLGAYSYGILVLKVGLPLWPAIVLTLTICLVANAIIGFICLRGNALTFGMLHMAFNILFSTIANKWISATGGDGGLPRLPRPGIFSDNFYYYLLVLGIVGICLLAIRRIMNSPFGKIAVGLRENEERLTFLGVSTKKYQLVIFILGGFFAGISGILLAILNKGVFTSYVSLILSAQSMMICLVGGAYSFLGPSLGAALVVIFTNTVTNIFMYWQGLLGVLMIITVLGFRGGILRSKIRKIVISTQDSTEEYRGRG